MIDKEKLLEIVENIYNDLIFDARKETKGIFWETISVVPNKHQILKGVSETMVNGVSGILVFLMEYYKETKSPDCLVRMQQAGEWLVHFCEENPKVNNVGFYYGRSGVVYALTELSLLTGRKDFLEKAETILFSCNQYMLASRHMVPANFGNGICGVLLMQLWLFDLTGKESILNDISINLELLLTRLRINESGIHFDQAFYSKKSLISFPEGSSGIAHVLIQLGTYFKNETLVNLSKQIFDYENACFSSRYSNWPDYANTELYLKRREDYLANCKKRNRKFFEIESDTVGWYIGAPGVGLSRITAVLAGLEEYNVDIDKAENKSVAYIKKQLDGYKKNKFTLLAGLGGVSLFLSEAQKLRKNSEHLSEIHEVANHAVKQYEELSYLRSDHYFAEEVLDNTLFTGECGVAYFFLKLIGNDSQGTILNPILNIKSQGIHKLERINQNLVYHYLLRTYYARSIELLKNHELAFQSGIPLRDFHNWYRECLKSLAERSDVLMKVYGMELQKLQLIKSNTNFHFTYIENKSFQEEHTQLLETITNEKLLRKKLYLNENCKLEFYESGVKKYLALKQVFNGVQEMELNEFSYIIFNAFKVPVKVEVAIGEIIKATGAKSKEEEEEIRQLTLSQIRQGLKVSLLKVKKMRVPVLYQFN